jgi:hypothetical protein
MHERKSSRQVQLCAQPVAPSTASVDWTRSDTFVLGISLCALLLAVPACGKAIPTANGQAPALTSEASSSAPETPRPERSGLSAPVVWKAPAAAAGPGTVCSPRADRLEVSEVRADADALYVDVAHFAVKGEATHPSASGRLAGMQLDGCPVRLPRVKGTLLRDWWQPSTLSVPLADLPDGDVDLTFAAFGAVRVVPLHKRGKDITHLRDRDRKGAVILPAVPAWHVPESLSLPLPNCEGVRP